MAAALEPSLVREVRDVAARYDVLQPAEADRAIELRLSLAEGTPGVAAAEQELGLQRLQRNKGEGGLAPKNSHARNSA